MEKKASEVINKCILEGDDVLGALSGLFDRKIRNMEKRHTKCTQLMELMNSGEKLNDDQKACALVTRELEQILDFLKEVSNGISSLTTKESGKLTHAHDEHSSEIKENGSLELRGNIGGFLEFVSKLKLLSFNVEELKKPENLKKITLSSEEIDNLIALYNLVKPKDICDTHARVTRIESIYDNFRKNRKAMVGYPVEGSYACVRESYHKIDESLKKIKIKRNQKTEKVVLTPVFNEIDEPSREFDQVVDRLISPVVDLKITEIDKTLAEPNLVKIDTISKIIQSTKISEKITISSNDDFNEGFGDENNNHIDEIRKKPQRNNYRREMGNNGRRTRNYQNSQQNRQNIGENSENHENLKNSENFDVSENSQQNKRNFHNRYGNRQNSRQNNRQGRSQSQNYQNNENLPIGRNFENSNDFDNIHVKTGENNVNHEDQSKKTFERKFNRQNGNRSENRGKRQYYSSSGSGSDSTRKFENPRIPTNQPGQRLETGFGATAGVTTGVSESVKLHESRKQPESGPIHNGAMRKPAVKVVIKDVPRNHEGQTNQRPQNSSGKTSISAKSTL